MARDANQDRQKHEKTAVHRVCKSDDESWEVSYNEMNKVLDMIMVKSLISTVCGPL